jgi:hypothetical protein
MPRERSIRQVPLPALLLAGTGLLAQIAWHSYQPASLPKAEALIPAPSLNSLRGLSLGEPEVLGKLLMLWLQAFDNQPGISIPFRELDYGKVIAWLERILQLDPRGQYPLLAASRLYAEVPVEAKQRQMLEFVYQQFLIEPNRRWPWLTHAVYIAKHRLRDPPLALKYAQTIAAHATGPGVPHWAQQMQVFVLEDMGELEGAKILLGGLLESGAITDPHELQFLSHRLQEIEKKIQP